MLIPFPIIATRTHGQWYCDIIAATMTISETDSHSADTDAKNRKHIHNAFSTFDTIYLIKSTYIRTVAGISYPTLKTLNVNRKKALHVKP